MHEKSKRYMVLAERLADTARSVVLPMFRKSPASRQKSDKSPVTEADISCEKALRAILADEVPDHAVLGEEFGGPGSPRNPARESTGAPEPDSEWLWVIDPIDGTRSFITGSPLFCTLIALLRNGKPLLGVIDAPATAERWTSCADATGFTGTRHNSIAGVVDCATSRRTAVNEATAAITLPHRSKRAANLMSVCAHVRYGGDAYNFGCVASGHLDIAVEESLQPHDYMAAIAVIEGAGGKISDFQGGEPSGMCNIIAAGNPALHSAALEKLNR